MITTTEMRNAIYKAIGNSSGRQIRFGRDRYTFRRVPTHSVYAAFIYISIAKSIKEAGWLRYTVLHANEFVFSLGRGNIASTEDTFSYFAFRTRKTIYELHCGMNVESNVRGTVLEIDSLVLPRSHAAKCRSNRQYINHRYLKSLFEVKHYGRSVDLTKAKEFVGTCHLVRCRGSYAGLVAKGNITPDALGLFANIRPAIGAFPNADLAGADAMTEEVITIFKRILS